MSRLSDLYKAMETLRKEGLSLNEDLEKQVSELEENIIKKEILPIVTETIAPALKQVQRELVLVVDYVPGMPISVHLSRKRNFAYSHSVSVIRFFRYTKSEVALSIIDKSSVLNPFGKSILKSQS